MKTLEPEPVKSLHNEVCGAGASEVSGARVSEDSGAGAIEISGPTESVAPRHFKLLFLKILAEDMYGS